MNRIGISLYDGVEEPSWLSNVEQFVLKVLEELQFDGEEVSLL